MIFEEKYDDYYHRWFAWRPVKLSGPDEWDRKRALNRKARVVWLRLVWRMRSGFGTYYALPWEGTQNNMLLTASEESHPSTP